MRDPLGDIACTEDAHRQDILGCEGVNLMLGAQGQIQAADLPQLLRSESEGVEVIGDVVVEAEDWLRRTVGCMLENASIMSVVCQTRLALWGPPTDLVAALSLQVNLILAMGLDTLVGLVQRHHRDTFHQECRRLAYVELLRP